ncbi:rac GTPase-activating protein 1-like [Tiliqua scincoides]|uniref:rac GTPase-activating protein 1-like n=1 Tax=Tiliqua scincoides TaxID=71010 RepID=UPI0034633BDB
MNHLCTWLWTHVDQFLHFIELTSSIEQDYLQIARCLEGMRQRCFQLNQDLLRVRDQLCLSESERSVLEVKLKHARNQVEVEMKKRHRAEAELEKQERKMQLIYNYLMTEPHTSPLNENQHLALAALTGHCSNRNTLQPGRRLSVVEELGTSIVSDISFDHSDDETDLHVIKPYKGRDRRRSSLAPLIQPVVLAKRSRSSVAPAPNVTLRTVTVAERSSAHSLPPIAVLPCRRSQQNSCTSTLTDLATIRGTNEMLGGSNSQTERDTAGSETGEELKSARDLFPPPPPQEAPLHQHHFTSKTVIRLEFCVVCKSRLRFGRMALKCRPCHLLVHLECKDRCPSLCMPGALPRLREGILADFAPSTPPLVPHLVVQCVNEVEKRGLQETGIYRVPGAECLVREWKHKLLHSQGAAPSLDHVADVNVICGILKDFLRGLKEPLVTFYLHSAFLNAAEISDESARHTALCHVVMKLPPANRDTLAFLMLHLHRVMESPKCQMDQHNLSRIFGPTLIGHSVPSPTPFVILKDTPRQFQVVANFLALPCEFWKRFVKEEQENLVPSAQQSSVVNEQGLGDYRLWEGAGGRYEGTQEDE